LIKDRYFKYKTKEDDLLVFSKTSGRLYGFDQWGASLFSFLEQNRNLEEELLQNVKENENIKILIESITKLLDGEEEPEEKQFDAYNVEYPKRIENILPTLDNLKSKRHLVKNISLHIHFKNIEEKWSIYFNGKRLSQKLELVELLPRLLDYIRIAFYHSIDYLISLHAATLYFKETPLLLPAVSGSGKSTLTTYLLQQGFSFLTDEVALIDTQKYMRAIPMAITLKEGSWKVLEKEGISFDTLFIHKRFDGQKLRFLPPYNIAKKNLKATNAFLVFPKFQEGAETEIKELSTLETLRRITESGYEVTDSYDWENIHQWIELIEGFQKFTLTYSHLEEAYNNLKRLINI